MSQTGLSTFLSFGAKTVRPEILEQMLVGRQQTVGLLEQYAREIARNGVNHQVFVVGPRGSGKTHMLRVLYHRIRDLVAQRDVVVAYFAEEEYGISGYLDFLIRVINAFMRWYDGDRDKLESQLDILRETPERRQEYVAETIISDYVGDKPLLILSENFDAVLEALAKKGQDKLRAWLYQHNRISIIATSQSLSPDLGREDRPFYGFFSTIRLTKLTYEQSLELLQNLAQIEQRPDMIEHLAGKGRAQVRAIYELVKGNHRLLVTFYEFLKAESMAELSVIFIKTMNDLKPYYETFIRFLPPQQQKIVHYLALAKIPQRGTDIAKNCFIATTSLTKQLSELQRRHLLDALNDAEDKRNKLYDVSEPLLRIAIEIGEQREGIAALFVDFLALYYSDNELNEQKIRYESQYENETEPLLKQKLYYEVEARREALKIKKELTIRDNNSSLDFLNPYQLDQDAGEPVNNFEKTTGADYYVEAGLVYFEQNHYQQAIEAFQQAVILEADNKRAWNGLGIAYANQDQYELAIKAFQQTIFLKADNYQVWYNLGGIYNNQGRYEQAVKAFQEAIALEADNNITWNSLGIAYGNQGQYELAVEAYKKAIALKNDDYQIWYNLGVAYGSQNQYELATEAYQRAIGLQIDDHHIWNKLGVVYINQDQYELAIETLQQAIALKSDNKEAWYYLGIAYGSQEQYDRAVEALQQAINIDSANDDVWNGLGVIYTRQGEYELATGAYKKAIALKNDNDKAWSNLGMSHNNQEQYKQAIEAFQQAITLEANNDVAWNGLGIAYGSQDQYELAIEAFQRAITLKAGNDAAWTNLSKAYNHQGQYELAIRACKRAISLKNNDDKAWNNLGVAYYSQKRYEQAVEAFQQAIDIEVGNGELWFNLGTAYASQKQYEQAIQAYQQAVALMPSRQESINKLTSLIIYYLQSQTATIKILIELENWLLGRSDFDIASTYIKVYRRLLFNKEENALYELPKEQRDFFEREILKRTVD